MLHPLLKATPLNVPQTIRQALEFHQRGRLPEAERLYAAILAVRPDHVDALQMLGTIKLGRGELSAALGLVSAALRARPNSPQVLLNHGVVLNALNRHGEALASFDQALKLKSKYAEALNNRGCALAALGRNDEALEDYRKALAIKPGYPEAHYNRGNALKELGRHDEALSSLERAIALKPDYAAAYDARGTVLEELSRHEEALACYQRATAIRPDFAETHNNCGSVLRSLHRHEDALRCLDKALEIRPHYAAAFYNRGRVLQDLNCHGEAVASFEKAFSIDPSYRRAQFAACFAELPILYKDDSEILRQRASYARRLAALRSEIESGRINGGLSDVIGLDQPFYLAYQGHDDRELQSLYGSLVCRIMGDRYPPAALASPPAAGTPVRVGIVSSFFRMHSNWKIPIKGWISQLDRRRFQVFGYHTDTLRDAETDAAAALCDRFVHAPLSLDRWRQEILADALHVLIYPAIGMDRFAAQLGAQRLAPVQCSSWGHPDTSGFPTIDYYLSSDLMEPPDAANHYSEQLVRLPNLSIYYEPLDVPPVSCERGELGLRASAKVYWCGQSLYKYLPQFDQVFPRIAREVGDCQFVFIRHRGASAVTDLFHQRLEQAFVAFGLKASDHCVTLPQLDSTRFAACIGQCDAVLDSIGWSGCNSILESLPHNLPIVTLTGALMRGRHSTAILRMMGVTETITETVEGYVSAAVRLAKDEAWHAKLKRQIATNKHLLYRDRECISALEEFLDRVARPGTP
jgi:predicted O-linked N-acetylglucosamine transferase (SPINDLY family)